MQSKEGAAIVDGDEQAQTAEIVRCAGQRHAEFLHRRCLKDTRGVRMRPAKGWAVRLALGSGGGRATTSSEILCEVVRKITPSNRLHCALQIVLHPNELERG
jgi:hypothetical protein